MEASWAAADESPDSTGCDDSSRSVFVVDLGGGETNTASYGSYEGKRTEDHVCLFSFV